MGKKGWTKEQHEILDKLYPNKDIPTKTIAGMVDKAISTVRKEAYSRGLSRFDVSTPWTTGMVKQLKEKYQNADSIVALACDLNKAPSLVVSKANRMNMKNKRNWTKEQEKFILDNYKTMYITEIARKLRKTKHSVERKMERLGVFTDAERCRKKSLCTTQDISFIKDNYDSLYYKRIAKIIGKPVHTVRKKAYEVDIDGRRLKRYKAGNFSFFFNTFEERNWKIEYCQWWRDTIYVKHQREIA
jgi:hypothetical protein